MSLNAWKRSQLAALMLVATYGCGSEEAPAPETRAVTGALSAQTMATLDVPTVVAQDAAGQTFDGPVSSDGTFSLALPKGRMYRLFVTDLRASGRFSTETRVLWPGMMAWAQIPQGTTSDGPITIGTITPATPQDGVMNNFGAPVGAGSVTGGGGSGGGAAAGGSGAGAGSVPVGGIETGAGGGIGGTGGSGFGSGSAGSGSESGSGSGSGSGSSDDGPLGSGSATGGSGSGSSGSGASGSGGSGSGGDDRGLESGGGGGSRKGPSLCIPGKSSVAVARGSGSGIQKCGAVKEPAIPTCVAPGGTTTSDGTVAKPAAPPPASGAPRCESDKVAVQDSRGRWDCVKMETPVTYFYSEKPIKVRASVEFPRGSLTQWYPAVVDAFPFFAGQTMKASESKAKACGNVFGSLESKNGLLDWGTLDILGRDANVDAKLPAAAIDRYTWSFARQVAANPLRASNGQLEKFLFYRGIGNFSLPVKVTSQRGGKLALANVIDDAVGPVFFLNVTNDKGVFERAGGGIAKGATLPGHVPSMAGAKDVEAYADELAKSVREALDQGGLYDDESTAMVNTWKRQWFRTPGARLLYVAPQSWTDRSIPLNIDPKPESTKRVMVIRVEIITPELEAEDTAALKKLRTPATAPEARAHFVALGRFAEPRLRRAITLSGNPAYADALLSEVIESNHTTHTPTAGTKALAPNAQGPKYPGKGFVVHEWGTDTIVVGSDGTQLLGLQHEEEDLPRFVYDRRK